MTTTINPPSSTKAASSPRATAIDRIHFDLDAMVGRLRRETWISGTLAVVTAIIASLLILLVIDASFQPESAWLRVALWILLIGVVGMTTRRCLMMPLGQECDRLAMAWKLEQKRPVIEERLITSLQLTETPNARISSILEAVAEQAHVSLAGCQGEDLRGQEVFRRTVVAGACLTILVVSMWIWAPYLIPSLQNVLNPWNSRVLPHLNARIVPGHTHVAEGGDLRVTATASQLTDAVIEVIENNAVIASHQMATEGTGRTADFTLTGLKRDCQYRVRAGGLYSDRFQIFVDPKPVIKSCYVNLTFPEYTQLPPQVIDNLAEPIEVIHGTRIRIDINSTLHCVESSLTFNGASNPCKDVAAFEETGLWRHSWEFTAAADDLQRGLVTLVSEAGVLSEPFQFDVRTLPDLPPSIVIDQPALSEVIAKPDQSIQVAYHADDDFGCNQLLLFTQKNSEPPSSKELPHDFEAELGGERTVDLKEQELAIGDQLTVWLSISDNRPDEFGGPQFIDSRKFHVQIADDSIPVGQQVVRNETQSVIADLTEALDQLQLAARITEELQAQLDETDGTAKLAKDGVEKAVQLQDQIKNAEQTLRRLSGQGEFSQQRLFQSEMERVKEVANSEVAEAMKQAGLVPLSDTLPQQQEAVTATEESLDDAIEKLKAVRKDVEERAKQLELAAQLDELARQQERLAQKLKEGQVDAPDVRREQQQVADALQEVAEQDLDAKSEQFAQRAEQAAELTEAAAQLQQRQETLAKLDQVRNKEELDDNLLEMIAWEQEQIANETQTLDEPRRDIQPPAADAVEQAQEHANETAEAEREKNPNGLAEARKQMEAVPEKLRQKDLEQAEVEARQAGERLQEEAKSVPENPHGEDVAQQKEDDLDRLAKQQQRVGDAIEAIREHRPEEAVAKLQEQIADRTERLREKADELLQLPTKDPENQQAVREAREKLVQAEREAKAAKQLAKQQQKQAADPKQAGDPKQAAAQQKQAAKSLEEATQSQEKVCESCKECSNCNKPGGSSGSSGNAPKSGGDASKPGDSSPRDSRPGDSKQGGKSSEPGNPSSKQQQPDSQKLAAAADKAHQTARKPSPHQTQELTQALNHLADQAAQQAGYPNRSSKPQSGQAKSGDSSDATQQAGAPQLGSTPKPQGVQGNAGAGQSDVAQTQLRGRSTSNWTQSRRKLKNNVLDDQDSKIPEEFRSVVKDYFEELSRLESRQNKSEEQE